MQPSIPDCVCEWCNETIFANSKDAVLIVEKVDLKSHAFCNLKHARLWLGKKISENNNSG